jgi:hypothetical protein
MSPPLIEPAMQTHARNFIDVRRPAVLMVADHARSKRHQDTFLRAESGAAGKTLEYAFQFARQFGLYRRVERRRIGSVRPAATYDAE